MYKVRVLRHCKFELWSWCYVVTPTTITWTVSSVADDRYSEFSRTEITLIFLRWGGNSKWNYNHGSYEGAGKSTNDSFKSRIAFVGTASPILTSFLPQHGSSHGHQIKVTTYFRTIPDVIQGHFRIACLRWQPCAGGPTDVNENSKRMFQISHHHIRAQPLIVCVL